MLKAKIAVLVSGGGTNLQALIDAQKSGILQSGEIVLVLASKEGVYSLERAKQNNIPCFAFNKKELGLSAFEEKLLEKLDEFKIDIIVTAGFMTVLSASFVKRFPNRIINIHPALIPSFCGNGFYGLKVHEEALKYGVKVTGATTHFVNEITDGGKIIMQKAVEILDDDTPEVLQQRVMKEAEQVILPLSVEKVAKEIIKK